MIAAMRREVVSLSALQRSMVLSSLRSPRAGWYIVQDVCEVNHELDTDLLKEAWIRIADRHAALRNTVEFGPDGEPSLCVPV